MSRSWALPSSVPLPPATPRPVRAPSGAGSSWSALSLASLALLTRLVPLDARSTRSRATRASALRPFEIAANRVARPFRDAAELDARPVQREGREPAARPPRTSCCASRTPRSTGAAQENAALAASSCTTSSSPSFPSGYDEVAAAGADEPHRRSTRASRSRPARDQGIALEDVVVTDQGLVGTVDEGVRDASRA